MTHNHFFRFVWRGYWKAVQSSFTIRCTIIITNCLNFCLCFFGIEHNFPLFSLKCQHQHFHILWLKIHKVSQKYSSMERKSSLCLCSVCVFNKSSLLPKHQGCQKIKHQNRPEVAWFFSLSTIFNGQKMTRNHRSVLSWSHPITD